MPAATYGTKTGVREIVLTFDDGPHLTNTPRVLDILRDYEVPAMFFVVGSCIRSGKELDIVKRAFDEGHLIGNHGYSHTSFKTLSDAQIVEELNRTDELIREFCHPLKFFRPPYGAIDARVDSVLRSQGYTTVLWNVDPRDWDPANRDHGMWVCNAMSQIIKREDSLILMHDIHQTTVDYVDDLIRKIRTIPNVAFVRYA